jgi:GxxExxY protein
MEMHYKDKVIKDQRIDLIVEDEGDRAVVDLKSVSKLPDIATAQVLSYLKSTRLQRGLVINFGEKRLVDGVRRLSL